MTDELEGAVERARLLHPSSPVGGCGSRFTTSEGVQLACELRSHVVMRVGRLDFTRHLARYLGVDVAWSSRRADRV